MTLNSGNFIQSNTDTMKAEGARFKQMRLQNGFTCNALAKEMGFTSSRKIRRWEKGQEPIPATAWGHAQVVFARGR